MFKLHLALLPMDSDIEVKEIWSAVQFTALLKDLAGRNSVWIITTNGETGEILITEKISSIIECIEKAALIPIMWADDVFVQEYKTYEDAYAVALDMREGNPKCYCEEPPFSSLN